jgi:Fe2+ transport system protein FeoA
MKSPVVKRSIVVAGHKTSVSLEEAFWNGMKEISGLRNMTLSELVGEIDGNRQQGNLSSALSDIELESRLIELGFVEGARVEVLHEGLVGRDPIAVRVDNITIAVRRREAMAIIVA